MGKMKRYALMDNRELTAVAHFLERLDKSTWTREMRDKSYCTWGRYHHQWSRVGMGGTNQMVALIWYQHIHKPGSTDSRPSVIFRAMLRECGSEPSF